MSFGFFVNAVAALLCVVVTVGLVVVMVAAEQATASAVLCGILGGYVAFRFGELALKHWRAARSKK